ncbi:hypothetical protein [Dactylosporangium sp. CA-092794]|uniref:hypothetical protein n=1 Tax=Dactylosporangium sp. CA-092794 TaxID=3239929 RepID=UPI003D94F4A4
MVPRCRAPKTRALDREPAGVRTVHAAVRCRSLIIARAFAPGSADWAPVGRHRHDWSLTGAPADDGAGPGRDAAVRIAAVIGALLLAAAAAVLVTRRLRRRTVS